MYESITDVFAVTVKVVLGGSASKDFDKLAKALDKIHSACWLRNQQAEISTEA